jgi:hypothetical protein
MHQRMLSSAIQSTIKESALFPLHLLKKNKSIDLFFLSLIFYIKFAHKKGGHFEEIHTFIGNKPTVNEPRLRCS